MTFASSPRQDESTAGTMQSTSTIFVSLQVLYWSPGYGFCEILAPELARLQGELRVVKVQLILASPDDAKTNRELAEESGLKCPILVLDNADPLIEGAFRNMDTPSAYLLDEEGRVARPAVMGGSRSSPWPARRSENGRGGSGSPANGPCPRAGLSGMGSRRAPPHRPSACPTSTAGWSRSRITGAVGCSWSSPTRTAHPAKLWRPI